VFRDTWVLLTIVGMLACPFVCRDADEPGCVPSALREAGGEASRGSLRGAACCAGAPCSEDGPGGAPERLPQGCGSHPCVCNGALTSRSSLPCVPGASTWLAWIGLPARAAESLPAGGTQRRGIGLLDAPPCSGRAMRLVFESLLL